jgi:D-alanyl-D-alanine carboxypeptidase
MRFRLRKAIRVGSRLAIEKTLEVFMCLRHPPAPIDADDYARRVELLHRRMRIPIDYHARGMPLQREASELVPVVCGHDGKIHLMTPDTCLHWLAMNEAAQSAGITLLVDHAFRTLDEQAALLRGERGKIADRLKWIAAPGYSEHHTGRALDLETTYPQGWTEFQNTNAYHWLCSHAEEFGFRMSFPQGNGYGIIFEPWHWYFNRLSAQPTANEQSSVDLADGLDD